MSDQPTLQELEKRITELEAKLDQAHDRMEALYNQAISYIHG